MSRNSALVIDRLARYVAMHSVSGAEDGLADVIASELRAAGLTVHRQDNNCWCEIGDAPRPRLLLNSHIDTVPPASGWNNDPWVPQWSDGRITGLGANDAKGCVTAMIEAALAASRRIKAGGFLGGTLVLALTAEEETSGRGLGAILERLAPLDAAVVGEPTGLTPMIAQRGLLILRGIARGKTGHPANTPTDSRDNAIFSVSRDLVRLQALDLGPLHPMLGRAHLHVTKITGGVALNVVPDACEFFLDIRTTPATPHRALLGRLRSELTSELHVHSERLEPVETHADAAIVCAVRRALPGAEPAGSASMSDMVFLGGTPSVKIGPGQSSRSHTPNEYILERELFDGVAAYERIIQEYFGAVNRLRCDEAPNLAAQAAREGDA